MGSNIFEGKTTFLQADVLILTGFPDVSAFIAQKDLLQTWDMDIPTPQKHLQKTTW